METKPMTLTYWSMALPRTNITWGAYQETSTWKHVAGSDVVVPMHFLKLETTDHTCGQQDFYQIVLADQSFIWTQWLVGFLWLFPEYFTFINPANDLEGQCEETPDPLQADFCFFTIIAWDVLKLTMVSMLASMIYVLSKNSDKPVACSFSWMLKEPPRGRKTLTVQIQGWTYKSVACLSAPIKGC